MVFSFLIASLIPLLSALLDFSNDADLVRRLKNRDQAAMAELYDRYGRLVYSLIYRVVRNMAVAEDLVQETFLRIWNRVHAFDGDRGALGPWLLTIARNRAIDYLRSLEGRRRETTAELQRLEQPDLFCDVERDILNLDRARILKEACTKLSENQRLVIELAFYEGLTQTEMAERMKQPLGTVKTWMRAALKILRQQVDETATA
jgi:RNA polymerase sigma-70 factor (ECF subfamily)